MKLRLAVQEFCSKSLELTILIRGRNFLQANGLRACGQKKREKKIARDEFAPRKVLSRSDKLQAGLLVQTETNLDADLYAYRVTIPHRGLEFPLFHS